MTQDFAKKPRSDKSKRDSSPLTARKRTFSLATFFTGVVTGAFMTFLSALWYLKPAGNIQTAQGTPPEAATQAKVEEMQWDFYEIFPKLVVPLVQEYTETGKRAIVDRSKWLLQAGSFQDSIDADQRRATLILMGLDVSTQKVNVAGAQWHRVMVGPFDSQLERNRAQNKLAQVEIATIPIKIQDSLP